VSALLLKLVGIVGLEVVAQGGALVELQGFGERHFLFFYEMVDGVLDVEVEGFLLGGVVRKLSGVQKESVGEEGLLEQIVDGEILPVCRIHKLKIYS